MVFLRMRSNKITKTAKNALKMQFECLISRVYMFFCTRNPNLRSIYKPEVELMVFLRMRSNKITKTAKNSPQNAIWMLNFSCIYVFRHEESELEVHLETRSRFNGVSAHAQ